MERRSLILVFCVAAVAAACSSETIPEEAAIDSDTSPDVVATDDVKVDDDSGAPEDTQPPIDTPKPNYDVQAEDLFLVQSVQPGKGHTDGNETVAIVGYGFEPGCEVLFDGSPGTYVLYISETRLHVNTPAHPPGMVEVTVVTDDYKYTKLPDAFLYYNEVAVKAVTPSKGPASGGTPVTVTGFGFTAQSNLLFGHHKALSTKVLDNHTLLALTPPGTPGWADVIVSNPLGVHRLKDGFRYTTAPTINLVLPAAGATAGNQVVAIHGSGMESPVTVWFGSSPAATVEWVSDKLVRATTPPTPASLVDVRVDSATGTAILPDAYLFTDKKSTNLTILHVAPTTGDVAGGTQVAITANAIGDTKDMTVTFGGTTAPIISADPQTQTVLVSSPPHATPESVDVILTHNNEESVAANGFTYTQTMSITAVEPYEGPVEGGTQLVIKGTEFGANPTVFVGALTAKDVLVISPTEIHAVTPQGGPGQVDIRVVDGNDEAIMSNGFTYVPEQPELYVVIPNHGAIAGGTWVQIIGAGFSADATVKFDGNAATDITYVAPGLLTARTPPGKVGLVTVDVNGKSGDVSLEPGFNYYDPMSLFGGTWGDEVDVAINITVLDAMTAQPVPEAFVFLDDDPTTAYQGLTNAAGQITFSGPDLAGAHTIGVSKEGYVTYSVVHFDAENVTVFIKPIVDGQGNMNLIPPAIVQGKVTGLGKYVVGTPGECPVDVATDPVHCSECEPLGDCEGDALCADLGSSLGWHCLKACSEEADCPPKHACQLMEGSKQCIPTPGKKVAVCSGTKPYFRFFDVPLGPGAMADKDGNFSVVAFPTEIAVVCFGGFYLKNDEPTSEKLEKAIKGNPNNVFQPMVMGVARHLILGPATVEAGVEIKLDIPLNRTIHVRMEKPPLDDTDYLWAHTYLDFGEDGVIKMPVVRHLYNDEPFLLQSMPNALAGDIFDASFTFYAGAHSYKGYPRAYVVRQNVVEPQDDRMLQLVEGTWGTAPTGLSQSLQGAHSFSDKEVYTVGTGGVAYRFTGDQYLSMPSPTKKTLRSVHGLKPDNLWACGDDGTILNHNGASWSVVEPPSEKDLRAVRVESDGTVRFAGNNAAYKRTPEGEWKAETFPVGSWFAMDSTSPGDVWMVGRKGAVRHYNGTDWKQIDVPTEQGLRAVVAHSPADVWFAGEAGVLLHFDGVDYKTVPPLTNLTLNAMAHRGPDDMIAVGNFGTVLTYDGSAWVAAPAQDYNQDLHAVALPAGSSKAYTFGDHQLILGPIVAPARVSQPKPNKPLEGGAVVWTADDRVQPHYQHVEIFVPGPFGPVLIWELIADGEVGKTPLPDFAALKGTPGLQEGKHYLRVTR